MIRNLQALRAIAALLVVTVHLSTLLGPLAFNPRLFEFGACGVDLFFVISGFVMVHSTAARPTRPIGFLADRLIRIWPIYALITVLVFAIGMVVPSFRGATASGLDLVRSLAFIPYARASGEVYPVLFVGWTLNYEMFFYLLFSLSLMIRDGLVRTAAISITLAAIVILGLVVPMEGVVPRFYTAPIMLEFAFGMLIALADRQGILRHLPVPAVILCCAGVIMLGHGAFVAGERMVWSGIPAAFIVASAVALERREAVARWGGLQLLGAASYALYLTHPLVLSAMDKLAQRLGLLHSVTGALIATFAALIAVVGVAIVVHQRIELPLGVTLRRWIGHRPSKVDEIELHQPPAR